MQGLSINTFELENKMFPIIYGGDAPNTSAGVGPTQSRLMKIIMLVWNVLKFLLICS